MARKKPGAGGASPARFTPAKARNALAVAKVVGPVVLPVVTPFVVKGAAVVRDQWDRRKARKLGVSVDDLGRFTGRGGALHARISGAAEAVADVRSKPGGRPEDRAFADQAESTLAQLAAAVRAAERMPAARRRAAHKAVMTELDQLEQRLLQHLGL